MKKYDARHGFTLIELLVVIAVIAALAAILIPTINSSLKKAREASVQTSVVALETALKTYFQEYGKWPISGGNFLGQNANETTSDGIETLEDVVAMLTGDPDRVGSYDPDLHNPKGIQFLEVQDDSINDMDQYVDIWGNPYKFMVDADYDNRTGQKNFARGSDKAKKSVIVWSRGEDGADVTAAENEDDIRSW